MAQVAIAMSIVRPMRPAKPNTTPDRTWFCKKAVGVGSAPSVALGLTDVAAAVEVTVCPATVVTITAGGKVEVVETDIEVLEEGEEDEEEEETLEGVDVDEEVVEEELEVEREEDVVDGELDVVLSVDWVVVVGGKLGNKSVIMPNCLSWSNGKF